MHWQVRRCLTVGRSTGIYPETVLHEVGRIGNDKSARCHESGATSTAPKIDQFSLMESVPERRTGGIMRLCWVSSVCSFSLSARVSVAL